MLKVAWRSVVARRWRMISTALAVVVGIAFVTGTSVLGATLTQSVDALIDDSYRNLDAVLRGPGDEEYRAPIAESLVAEVAKIDGVASASSVVASPVQVAADDEPITSATALPTILYARADDDALSARTVVEGRWVNSASEATIDRSIAVAGKLDIGDTITVAAQTDTVGLTVVGITSVGDADSGATEQRVTVTRAEAQRLGGLTDQVDRIDVLGDESVSQTELARRIGAALAIPVADESSTGATSDTSSTADGDAALEVVTGETFLNEQQGEAADFVSIIEQAVSIFGWVALFVSVFVIQNTFTILVAQRLRELSLLRAVGARRRQIMFAVLIEAAVVGLVAGVIGVALGYVLAVIPIRLIGDLVPVGTWPTLPLAAALRGAVIGVVTTLVSALWPAIRASRTAPVAAMSSSYDDASHRDRWRGRIGAVAAVAAIGLAIYSSNGAQAGDRVLYVGLAAGALMATLIVLGPILVRPYAALTGRLVRRVSPNSGRLGIANARRAPRRTAATASALLIGVTVVTVTAMFANSVRTQFAEIFGNRLTGDLVIDSGSPGLGGLGPDIVEQVRQVDGVAAVSGVRFAPSHIPRQFLDSRRANGDDAATSDEKDDPASAQDDHGRRVINLGVDASEFFSLVDVGDIEGDPADMGADDIAIPRTLAHNLHLRLGDTIPVDITGTGPVDFRVAVITEKPVFVDRSLVIDVSAYDKHVIPVLHFDSYVYMKVDDGASIGDVRLAVARTIEDQPTAKVMTPEEFAGVRIARLDAALGLIFALLALAVLVAAVGIWNTLQLSVVERRRELSLLRAVGATRKQIRRQIGWEAAAIALLGTVTGTVAGLVIGRALIGVIEGIDLRPIVPVNAVIAILIGGMLAGMAAAAIPARRASNLDVLDGLGDAI